MANKSIYKFLLVEDTVIARIMAIEMIKHLNHTVDVVETGEDALSQTKKQSYDIILLDLGLPDIDGFTVARKIKDIDNINSSTPIIALTAHVDNAYKTKAKEAGMSDYLLKPLTEENLQQIIKKHLN